MLLEIFRERQWPTETDIINKVKPPGERDPGVPENGNVPRSKQYDIHPAYSRVFPLWQTCAGTPTNTYLLGTP